MPPWLQNILAGVFGKVGQAVEQVFQDFTEFETGKPFELPTEYIPVSMGTLAVKASVVRKSAGDVVDLSLSYLAGLLAKDAPALFAGKIVALEPFTVPVPDESGQFAEFTLQVQLQDVKDVQSAPAPANPVPVPPVAESALDRDFPK